MVVFGKVLETVKSQVCRLLEEHSQGILMADFVSNYGRYIGRPLNYPGLGYSTLHEFLSAVPDVARIAPSETDPNLVIVTMANRRFSKNTPPAPHYQSRHRDESLNSTSKVIFDPEVECLEADRYGRFSLCFRHDNFPDDMTDDDIRRDMRPAGNIVDVHRTEKLTFIRFVTKEELQKCLRMYGSEYSLGLGKQSKPKESPSPNGDDRLGGYHSEGPSGMRNRRQTTQKQPIHLEGPSGDADRYRDGERFQSHNQSNPRRKHNSFHDTEDEEESSTELFVSNIESKEDFEMAIETYNPKHKKLVERGVKKFAFVSMWNHEDAMAAIQDLHGQMQQTRRLSVAFNNRGQRSQSEHSSSESGTMVSPRPQNERIHNSASRPKTRNQRENGEMDRTMPQLEEAVDSHKMPPLVPTEEVHDPNGLYDLDTRILVKNFPPHSMESELRAVFKGYRVIDICVLNNNYSEECTSALLYMSTIYEAISAVTHKEGFFMDGHALQVLPPVNNVLLKKIHIRMDTGLRDWN